MRKIFVAVLFIVAVMIAGCGGSKELDKLTIGIDDNFAPIAFHNERGELVGFDIDLAKEAARRMGVKFEFKPIDWDKKREALVSGKIDMIWNGLDITDERKEYMIFSKHYMDDRQIILVKSGNDQDIRGEGDLNGKIVGVQAGSSSENYFNQDVPLKKILGDFKVYNQFEELLDALQRDEIDVLICDELIARYELNTNPDKFEIVDIKIGTAMKTAIGFRKDDVELRDKVQAAFDSMIKDGTAKKISEQWFNADLIKHI